MARQSEHAHRPPAWRTPIAVAVLVAVVSLVALVAIATSAGAFLPEDVGSWRWSVARPG